MLAASLLCNVTTLLFSPFLSTCKKKGKKQTNQPEFAMRSCAREMCHLQTTPELQVKLLPIAAVRVSRVNGGQAWCQSLQPLLYGWCSKHWINAGILGILRAFSSPKI